MSRSDIILIAALAAVALAAWPLTAAAASGDGAGLVLVSGPAGESELPLDVDRRIEVESALGDVEVEISDGSVRVSSASCPDHVCVATGRVDAAGSVIACVPSRVVIVVGGADHDGLDARIR